MTCAHTTWVYITQDYHICTVYKSAHNTDWMQECHTTTWCTCTRMHMTCTWWPVHGHTHIKTGTVYKRAHHMTCEWLCTHKSVLYKSAHNRQECHTMTTLVHRTCTGTHNINCTGTGSKSATLWPVHMRPVHKRTHNAHGCTWHKYRIRLCTRQHPMTCAQNELYKRAHNRDCTIWPAYRSTQGAHIMAIVPTMTCA